MMPDLWQPWTQADAAAAGFIGVPGSQRSSPYRLPVAQMPQADRACAGEIGRLFRQRQEAIGNLDRMRPTWEPDEERLQEQEYRLKMHRTARVNGQPGLPFAEAHALETEVPRLREYVQSLKAGWNREMERFTRLNQQIASKFQHYTQLIALAQFRAANGVSPLAEDLEAILHLVGSNPLTTAYLDSRRLNAIMTGPNAPAGYEPR